MNNYTYKVNFNSIGGVRHVRIKCLILYKKHFLKLLDFTPAQFTSLLTLAAQLKADKKKGKEVQKLTGKNIALIFKKTRPVPVALSKLPHLTRARALPI